MYMNFHISSYIVCRVNDPVASKLLRKAGEMLSLAPPDDESIRTLYVGGLDQRVTEDDLRDFFYAYGEVESIRLVAQRACAFVTYTTRDAAEKAAENLANKLVIKGLRLKLMWGRPQAPRPDLENNPANHNSGMVTHGGMLPRSIVSQQQSGQEMQSGPPSNYLNILPPPLAAERPFYPSMDPQRMGSVAPAQDSGGTSGENQNQNQNPSFQRGPYGPAGVLPPYQHLPYQQVPQQQFWPYPQALHSAYQQQYVQQYPQAPIPLATSAPATSSTSSTTQASTSAPVSAPAPALSSVQAQVPAE
jgi:pre-mRNA-splicing factor RBM22/SLT11